MVVPVASTTKKASIKACEIVWREFEKHESDMLRETGPKAHQMVPLKDSIAQFHLLKKLVIVSITIAKQCPNQKSYNTLAVRTI